MDAEVKPEFQNLVSLQHAYLAMGVHPTETLRYVDRGVWIEGKEVHRASDGSLVVDMLGVQRWVTSTNHGPPKRLDPPPEPIHDPSPVDLVWNSASKKVGSARRKPKPVDQGRAALYRHFDAKGSLLYVGISLDPTRRLDRHARDSHWSIDIATVTIEWHDTRQPARAAEVKAIRTECPTYNILDARKMN